MNNLFSFHNCRPLKYSYCDVTRTGRTLEVLTSFATSVIVKLFWTFWGGLEVSPRGRSGQVGPLEVCVRACRGDQHLALMSFSQIVPVAPKFRGPGLFEAGQVVVVVVGVFKAHKREEEKERGEGWRGS